MECHVLGLNWQSNDDTPTHILCSIRHSAELTFLNRFELIHLGLHFLFDCFAFGIHFADYLIGFLYRVDGKFKRITQIGQKRNLWYTDTRAKSDVNHRNSCERILFHLTQSVKCVVDAENKMLVPDSPVTCGAREHSVETSFFFCSSKLNLFPGWGNFIFCDSDAFQFVFNSKFFCCPKSYASFNLGLAAKASLRYVIACLTSTFGDSNFTKAAFMGLLLIDFIAALRRAIVWDESDACFCNFINQAWPSGRAKWRIGFCWKSNRFSRVPPRTRILLLGQYKLQWNFSGNKCACHRAAPQHYCRNALNVVRSHHHKRTK